MLATTPLARCALGTFAALAALLVAASANAQIYKCRVDGKTVFADQPCAADAKPIDVRPASGRAVAGPVSAPAQSGAAPINSSSNPQAVVARMEHERSLRDIDHRISVEHSRIREQEDRMSGEIAALRAKKAQANNNLAGAMWEQSISQEMSAVVARYDVRIRAIRGEIERLQGERDRLAAQGNNRP